jgi:hypothetical protein
MSYQAAVNEDTAKPVVVNVDEVSNPTALTDEALIKEGEAAAERFGRSRKQILPMARGLAAAKRKYPATQDFNRWLDGSPYSTLGDHDRSALINIGKHLDGHKDVIVEFITGTKLSSPQLIWDAIRDQVGAPKKAPPAPKIDPSCYDSNSTNDPAGVGPGESTPTKADEPTRNNQPKEKSPATDEPARQPHELWDTNERFDLAVLTPSERDLKRLRTDYADPETVTRMLPLHDRLEESAAIVVAAQLRDLPTMTRYLERWGFKNPRVLLRAQPASADVTKADVLIAAERGDIEFHAPESWLDQVEPIDAAERLYEASRTLHLFATKKQEEEAGANESRCLVVGDASWLELPSVR